MVTTSPGTEWQLSELNVDWYLDYSSDVSEIPEGKNKLLYIPMRAGDSRMSPADIQSRAVTYPGAVWYLGGEPNVPTARRYTRITPEEYIPEFRYYRQHIKAADPTARITGPSVLNWDFTCRGCGGYMSGEEWMRSFVDQYTAIYGVAPQVDIWALDSYPLTWDALPTVEWGIVGEQVENFRQYLEEEVPGHAETPIWLTEVAAHWAYAELAIKDWDEEYEWDAMEGYMLNLVGWLRRNSDRLHIGKWFFYRAHVDPREHAASQSYAGIYFFESPEAGAQLNQLGRVYSEMATGGR